MAKITADVRLGEQEYKGINTVSLPKTGVSTGERATFTLDEGLTGIANTIDGSGNLITTAEYNTKSISSEDINVWPSNGSADSVYLGDRTFQNLSGINVGSAIDATNAVNATNVGLSAEGTNSNTITIKAGTGKTAATFTVNNVDNAVEAESATNVDLTTEGSVNDTIQIQAGNGAAAKFTVNNVNNAKSANKVLISNNVGTIITDGMNLNIEDGVMTYATLNPINVVTFVMPENAIYNSYAKVSFNENLSPQLNFELNDKASKTRKLRYLGKPGPVKPNVTYEISFMNDVIAIAEVGELVSSKKE